MQAKSEKTKSESDYCLEKRDAVDEKMGSLNCGFEPLLDGITEKRAKEVEQMVCLDKPADSLEVDMGKEGTVILMEDKRETDKERVECVTVAIKEGKDYVPVISSKFDPDLKEEIQSSLMVSASTPHKEAMECEKCSANVESGSIFDDHNDIKIVSGNEDNKPLLMVIDGSNTDVDMTKEKVKTEEAMVSREADNGSSAIDKDGEAMIGVKKRKRGRKSVESGSIFDDHNDIKIVSGNEDSKPLLMVIDGSNTDVDMTKEKVKTEETMVSREADNGCSAIDKDGEAMIGVKKRKRGRKRKTLESSKCNGNVKVKKERVEKGGVGVGGRVLRSRPMTINGGFKVDESGLNESFVGFKRKMEAECLDQTDLKNEVNKSTQPTGKPQKKQKRRGRPPKVKGEASFKNTKAKTLDQIEVQKEVNENTELKRRVRPPKSQGEATFLHDSQNKQKDKVIKNLKRKGRPPKSKAKDVQEGSTFHNDETISKDPTKVHDVEAAIFFEKMEGRKRQQFVRDKLVSMVMKAGWIVEHRPRENRDYLDAVYVDLEGKTYWSITKAYNSLKKRIEDGKAHFKEVSAFYPLPDWEISVLLRVVSKVRSDKNKKKKKNKDKGIIEGETVINRESPPKKKPIKKTKKDGTKKKETNIKSAKRSSGPKIRDKSRVSLSSTQSQAKDRQSRKPCLVARSSSKGLDQDKDGCLIYSGKRNLLSWMIDLGVISPGGKLQYGEGRRRNGLPAGTVARDGVHCSCCNEVMGISKFVSHGDFSLKNLFFQSGSSFLKCLLESWRKEEESNSIKFNYVDVNGDDPNDDTCNICGDGGDLICCDGCPSTFHQSCLDIQNFPSGVWHCVYCSCKFCGLATDVVSQMNDSHHASEMLSCCLCEEKFHWLCIQEEDAPNVDSSRLSFCGKKCQGLFEQLQTFIGVKVDLEEGFTWTLLQRADVSQDSTLVDAPENIETNSKLAVAFSVMDECFVPIMDERSGVNMIHDVVYNCGSNFRRLNYSGFFTAILEKDDELISAASIRIHGHRLAEMPFIGTRHMYRRQGMCRRLLDAIESALSSIGVKELVIPAIPELFKTWTNVFGFKPLKKSNRQAMKSMSIIVFPGTDILQKPLIKNQNLDPAGNDRFAVSITAVKDDNALHSETKFSNSTDVHMPASVKEEATLFKEDQTSESETLTASFQVPKATTPLSSESEHIPSDSDVRSSEGLAREDKVVVPKNTFDLNLQPSPIDTDTDIDTDNSQLNNHDALTRDPQVCKNSFEVDNSMHDSKSCVLV